MAPAQPAPVMCSGTDRKGRGLSVQRRGDRDTVLGARSLLVSFNAVRPPGRLSAGSLNGVVMLSVIGCLD